MFFKFFIFAMVFLLKQYLSKNFQLFNYRFVYFNDYFKVGNFVRPLYVGTWQSTQSEQGDFVKSQNGDIILSLDYMPFNKQIENKLIFNIEIFTKQYIEDQNMIVYTELDLISNTQTQLTGNYEKSVQKLVDKIFTLKGDKKCKVQSVISLQDKEGNPLNIQTNEISNMVIKGGVKSQDCNIDFTFESHPIFLNLGGIFLFTVVSIIFIILGFTPFYKAIQNEGDLTVMHLNGYFLLFNILVDICIMMINVTIAMRILPYYFEFLILITFFLMISILFKFRIYLFIYEQYYLDLNLPEEQLQKQKFYLLIKTFIGIVTVILIANVFIIHYYFFLILFLYPIFQIFYNCYYVVRKNCFIWKVHVFLILPQMMYPFALRSNLFEFFKLRSDPRFVTILICMSFFFLFVLMLQRYIGRNFFLPRICIPDYYNYFKKIKKDQTYADCPICMAHLTQKPTQDEIELQEPLLTKQYMQTPCGHQFHKECLQQWMDQKLHCPYCRTVIPPYQLIGQY